LLWQKPDIVLNSASPRAARDPRGRLGATENETTRYFLGSIECLSGVTLYCDVNASQPWPLGGEWNFSAVYDSKHNYFAAGAHFQKEELPAFYSAASLPFPNGGFLILTGLDEKAHAYSYTGVSGVYSGWGDDIVPLGIGCDSQLQVLVTGTGDWTQADHLQLYEIFANRASTKGEPLNFPGPITALWPSDDGKSAHVVSRDLATGEYEASIVTVVCNN